MTARDPATVGARRVLLARYRPGLTGQVAHTVHLIPLPARTETAGAVHALCGARLGGTQIETVTPGEGTPCTLCLVVHLSGNPPPVPASLAENRGSHTPDCTGIGRLAAADEYRAWGWPVRLRHDQIWLSLDTHAVALIIPTTLVTDVTVILAARRCPAPVLAHPGAPDHQIVLGGECYGVPLPWPPGVHRATRTLPLPPTVTPRGALTWVHPPVPQALQLCREIDIFGALHTLGKVGGDS